MENWNYDLFNYENLESDYQKFLKEREAILPETWELRQKIEHEIKLALIKMFKNARELANSEDENLGFFRYEDILNIPLIKKYFNILAVFGDRNIGKSWATRRLIRKTIAKSKKFLMLRNRDKEVKAQALSDSKPEGWLTENLFTTKGSMENPDILNFEKEEVGHYRALNTFANFKSVDLPNVGLIIYEEFAEIKISEKFLKMVKLFSTVQRFNPEMLVILQGNYVNPEDEVSQKLGVGTKKLKPEDIAIFDWYIGSIIINVPKDIYRKPKEKQKDLGYRASMGDFDTWQQQHGGNFLFEEPSNILNDRELELSTISPVFNIYTKNIFTANTSVKNYGAYKITLYHIYGKDGKPYNVIKKMVENNNSPILVYDNLLKIRYPQSHLLSIDSLENVIYEWQSENIFTTDIETHNIFTQILALAKTALEKIKAIEEIENMVE